MATEPDDPPRKFYGLKPRTFERLNAAGTAPEKSTAHDVRAMLAENRAVEQRHGQDEVEFRPTRSRRKRDYWLLLIGGNLTVAALVALFRFNVVSLIFGLAAIILITLSLTWVMWFVMDDY